MSPSLEHYPLQNEPVRRIPLTSLPFRIGRSMAAQFVISSAQVSKEHVEIFRAGEQFRIRDLGSTNGTFMKGARIADAPLCHDDIFHVAHEEFRFLASDQKPAEDEVCHTKLVAGKAPVSVIRGTQHLQEMIRQQWVRTLFQPIVDLNSRGSFGYEALGRGMHDDLTTSPAELFHLADRCGMAISLSELFRQVAVVESAQLPCGPFLFLNLHPSELTQDNFLTSLRALQAAAPAHRQVVLEIHENATCDMPTLLRLRREVKELGMQIAYDDFGAGQSRFFELAEMPPDFVKLDMRLIKNIDRAEARRNLLRALARASVELGIQVIAEGVETVEEAEVCRELGCQLGQGYFFGRPQSAVMLKPKVETTQCINVADLRARLKVS